MNNKLFRTRKIRPKKSSLARSFAFSSIRIRIRDAVRFGSMIDQTHTLLGRPFSRRPEQVNRKIINLYDTRSYISYSLASISIYWPSARVATIVRYEGPKYAIECVVTRNSPSYIRETSAANRSSESSSILIIYHHSYWNHHVCRSVVHLCISAPSRSSFSAFVNGKFGLMDPHYKLRGSIGAIIIVGAREYFINFSPAITENLQGSLTCSLCNIMSSHI